jgi:AmpD protein
MMLDQFMYSADNDQPSGWLQGACWLPSPNYDPRPSECGIDLLVIHNISLPAGVFGGPWIERLFLNQLASAPYPELVALSSLRVSAHFLIRRQGQLIQFVDIYQRAWHAGQSYFQDRERCNDFSIGIELEGTDTCAYETIQYQVLTRLTQVLFARCPEMGIDRIVGHCDIAPQRKTDPGPAFDWVLYRQLLSGL